MTGSETNVAFIYGRERILKWLDCSRKTALAMRRAGLPIQVYGKGDGARWACDRDAVRAWFARNPRSVTA